MPNPSYRSTFGPCFTCAYWAGQQGWTVFCSNPDSSSREQRTPAHGCCMYEREPGADDEDGDQLYWSRIHAWYAEPWRRHLGPMIYAGIGSRQSPPIALRMFTSIGQKLAGAGWTLRSGAAEGADRRFEEASDMSRGKKEIFLPWQFFNGHKSQHFTPPIAAYRLAAEVHPAWERLQSGERKLHARNAQQVLGKNLDDPVSAVICWTPDGCESGAHRTRETGGTGTAIAIASAHGIPVFNLQSVQSRHNLAAWLAARGVNFG